MERSMMTDSRCHLAFVVSLAAVGLLSATVIPPEELEANKPQLEVSKNGNYLDINWEAQSGVYYFVEGTENLETWITGKLLKDNASEGNLAIHPAIATSKAFYRLSLEGDPGSARLRADDDGDMIINLLEANRDWDAFETASSDDEDSDGIPDYWEMFHFGSLDQDASYVAVPGGLTLAEAYANATDPKDVDSDGDGWTNAQEIAWGWDPNYDQSRDDGKYSQYGDSDGDGVSNQSEALNGSNPSDAEDTLIGYQRPRYAIIDLGVGVGPMQVSSAGHVLYHEQETIHVDYLGELIDEQVYSKIIRNRFGVKAEFDEYYNGTAASSTYGFLDMNNKGELLLAKGINGAPFAMVKVTEPGAIEPITISGLGAIEADEVGRYFHAGKINDDFDFILYYTRRFEYYLDYSAQCGSSQIPKRGIETKYYSYSSIGAENLFTGYWKSGAFWQSTCEIYATGDYAKLHPTILTNQDIVFGSYQALIGNAKDGWNNTDHNIVGTLPSLPTTASDNYSAINHNGLRLKGTGNVLVDGTNSYSFPASFVNVPSDKIRGLTTPENGDTPLEIFNSSMIALQKTQIDEATGNTELVPFDAQGGAFYIHPFEEIFYQHDAAGKPTINRDWSNPKIEDISDQHGFIACSATKDGVKHALLLLKMDLEWISKDETNNKIDDNPNEGGGKRYYPGKRLPTEAEPRNVVTLKVSVPGLAGKKIKLKAFDVDDPTKDVVPFLEEDDVDLNGSAGNDNFTDYLSTPITGQFVYNSASSPTAIVTLGADGEAEIDFQVGMQPGNNYRVVAVIKDIEGNFDQLQVNNATTTDTFVSSDNEPIPGFTGAGTASPMLTVWRKLHIEQDSMEAIATSGNEKNFVEGTIFSVDDVDLDPGVGTVVDLGFVLEDYQNDEFEKGRFVVSGKPEYDTDGFPYYEVISFTHGHVPFHPNDSGAHATVTINRSLNISEVGGGVTLYDDDERGLPSSHQPLLPRYDLINDMVKSKYEPAYITVVDVDTLGLNHSKTVSFKRNMTTATGAWPFLFYNETVADDSEDLANYSDDKDFWNLLVTACFQASDSEDEDPGAENAALEGEFIPEGDSPPHVVIFLEGVREDLNQNLNSRLPANIEHGQNIFLPHLSEVVAHEIGHAPENDDGIEDHDERGLMGDGIEGSEFSGTSVKRFREAQTWRN